MAIQEHIDGYDIDSKSCSQLAETLKMIWIEKLKVKKSSDEYAALHKFEKEIEKARKKIKKIVIRDEDESEDEIELDE